MALIEDHDPKIDSRHGLGPGDTYSLPYPGATRDFENMSEHRFMAYN